MEIKIIARYQNRDPDQTLIRALGNAHRWAEVFKKGTPVKQIAAGHARSDRYARRVIPLAKL